MVNWNRIKLALFEGINPYYYHGKRFARLESDLQQGFLRGYVNDYSDAMLAVSGALSPDSSDLPVFLTRDRVRRGKYVSGLEQAKIFLERDSEGVIYVLNSNIIGLRGFEDDGKRNVIVRKPINLRMYLERILINSNGRIRVADARNLLADLGYSGIGVCNLEDWQQVVELRQ